MLQRTWVSLFLWSLPYFLSAASKPIENGPPEWKRSIDSLQIRLENQEEDLKRVQERLQNQSLITDDLHQNIKSDPTAQLRSQISDIVHDLKALKEHINELSNHYKNQENKIDHLEGKVKTLQSALQSMLTALGIQDSSAETMYVIKNGDSLEKIAKQHRTTVQRIKECNRLSNDRIFVGQKINIPASK